MRIGKTVPPAALPITLAQLCAGILAVFGGVTSIARFRDELCAYFQVEHCFLMSSGKAGLVLILKALQELHPGRDEVLIPAFNCFSVPAAIVRAGLKISLCDIDAETLDFDYKQLRGRLRNPRLLCVIPAHLFGRPADMDRLKKLLAGSEVTLVEDAAQAFGGEVAGRKLGTLGDVGFFSFGRGKALSTVGGGAILTNRRDLAERIGRIYRCLPSPTGKRTLGLFFYALALAVFQSPRLFWLPNAIPALKLGQTIYDPEFGIGGFTAFQAGLARGWRDRIERFKRIRRRHTTEWAGFLNAHGQRHYSLDRDEGLALIRLPWRVGSEALSSRILARSRRDGLGIAAVFPSSIAGIPALGERFRPADYPMAEKCARTLVTLPVHPLVGCREVARIKRALGELLIPEESPGCWVEGEKAV